MELAGTELRADASGALYLAAEQMLVVADLHLEKGSCYAARRVLLPPYDSAATLARLAAVVARYAPRRIVALGDSFHDRRAGERMGSGELAALRALQKEREWIWIAGNHDPEVPKNCGGEATAELRVGTLVLRHEPGVAAMAGEIAGHLHPVAHVQGTSGSVRRRCFVSDKTRCILPAFGAYTGGLNLRDRAFAGLFAADDMLALVLGRDRVHAVPRWRCLPDAPRVAYRSL